MSGAVRSAEALREGRVAATIREQRLVVVLRRIEPQERLLALVGQLVTAGVRAFEITFDARSAAEDLVAVRRRVEADVGSGVIVGAGTLLRPAQLHAAIAAGADFGVAPLLDPRLVEEAWTAGLPFIPGALTPTEVVSAWSAGATFVKLFPASAVGPAFVRELRGPFPAIGLIPTGGVDGSNAAAFLEAGAAAVGIGSAITRVEPADRRAIVAAVRSAGRPS